jgi:hypothetical protein
LSQSPPRDWPDAMKTSFRDRHERLKYLKACETARRIVRDPGLIEQARRFVEEAMAPDPHQRSDLA